MNNDLDLLISFLQPIKELLLDDTVSEIMGNPNGQWWFERRGRVEHAEIIFDAKAHRTIQSRYNHCASRGMEIVRRRDDQDASLLHLYLPRYLLQWFILR